MGASPRVARGRALVGDPAAGEQLDQGYRPEGAEGATVIQSPDMIDALVQWNSADPHYRLLDESIQCLRAVREQWGVQVAGREGARLMHRIDSVLVGWESLLAAREVVV
jgi:hypothetical protein